MQSGLNTCATCVHRKYCAGAEEGRWCGNYEFEDRVISEAHWFLRNNADKT